MAHVVLNSFWNCWENPKKGEPTMLDISVDGVCVCVLADFHNNGIPAESRWVRRSELEKLMDFLRDKCLEYWDHPRREALTKLDTQLPTCDSYDRVLAAQLDEVLIHLEECNLIIRKKTSLDCVHTLIRPSSGPHNKSRKYLAESS